MALDLISFIKEAINNDPQDISFVLSSIFQDKLNEKHGYKE